MSHPLRLITLSGLLIVGVWTTFPLLRRTGLADAIVSRFDAAAIDRQMKIVTTEMGRRRTFEARAAIGVAHAPFEVTRGGSERLALPPDVEVAAARLQQIASSRFRPDAQAAAGIADLLRRRTASAVSLLERSRPPTPVTTPGC
jgi:hypothetical protein